MIVSIKNTDWEVVRENVLWRGPLSPQWHPGCPGDSMEFKGPKMLLLM